MPEHMNVLDDMLDCGHCRRKTLHRRVVYIDIEYRTCYTCQTKTTHVPDKSAEHGLRKTKQTRTDPGRPGEDRKAQTGKRQYNWSGYGKERRGRPRKKKDEDEESGSEE